MTILSPSQFTYRPVAVSGGAAARAESRDGGVRVAPRWLIAALFAAVGADQLLLWRFAGFASCWLVALGTLALAATCLGAARLAGRIASPGPSLPTLATCIGIAALLYLLGGEGRLFYANIDWQVRDAILHDMTINPWPFAYTARGPAEILRAPLGMYLAPALAGKALGPGAADVALLAQNAVLLGMTLALASVRFRDRRNKFVALAVFLGFSGMDAIGHLLVAGPGTPLPDHLEPWAQIQFSAHVTQAFWVPQHALSGWIAAMLFLLWKDARAPVGLLLAALPLLALWSPLGAIGALPFAAFAGVQTLREGKLTAADVALPALATLLAAPVLLYLTAAGDSVGLRILAVPIGRWFLFELAETIPILAAVAVIGTRGRHGPATLAIVGLSLAVLPFLQIGASIDLMMRGSIPALALLAVFAADAIVIAGDQGGAEKRGWGIALALVLAVGSITAFHEIARAFLFQPSPRPLCRFPEAWDQSFADYGKSTYLAPVQALAAPIRPAAPTLLPQSAAGRCWDRRWATRR